MAAETEPTAYAIELARTAGMNNDAVNTVWSAVFAVTIKADLALWA